jgi:hypothetical protein
MMTQRESNKKRGEDVLGLNVPQSLHFSSAQFSEPHSHLIGGRFSSTSEEKSPEGNEKEGRIKHDNLQLQILLPDKRQGLQLH